MAYQIYVIKTKQDFDLYFPKLEKIALRNEIHRTYEVGLDLEYITEINREFKWISNKNNTRASCLLQLASKSCLNKYDQEAKEALRNSVNKDSIEEFEEGLTNTINEDSIEKSKIALTNSENVCLLVFLKELGPVLPKKLIKLIKNDNWIKYGVGIEQDLALLASNYNLDHCGGGIELKSLALLKGIVNPSLKTLAKCYLNLELSKSKSVCDWSKELNAKELDYAAKDAIVSYELGKCLLFDFNQNCIVLELKYENKSDKKDNSILNYIGELKEYADGNKIEQPQYIFDIKDGHFEVRCKFENQSTLGRGFNKKTAKTIAAGRMYNLIFDRIVEIKEVETKSETNINYIGKIQEYAQKHRLEMPVYTDKSHIEGFEIECYFLNKVSFGNGNNKKTAKTEAAKNMYQLLFEKE